ncbi:MAG: exodeoxyribonuclease VII large subunit, partial [Clostridiales bacterium]
KIHALFNDALQKKITQYQILKEKLAVLSPLNTLERGYSLCLKEKKPLHDQKDVKIGEEVQVQLEKGHLLCRVLDGKEGIIYDEK